ncbi:DnaJ-like cysteine-rich domain-containing protein [Kineosporia babensis]|uniref:Uncharacterized protein n=1 Tax=Kineosporia babensis TaxID=499548 RepID=A0A9X1SYJ0_9ACTN|nr:hypothetical protein [Kineosporia babensis]MCD5317171.1 hypothetical protein [Kineosporia babensis]
MNTVITFAVLVTIGYALVYLLAVVIFPFRPCRRCGGRGVRHNRITGGGFRQCSQCAGTGRAVRPGRKLLERLNTDPGGRWTKITGDPRPLDPRRRRG